MGSNHYSLSTSHHCVLFDNPRGPQIRTRVQTGLWAASSALLTLIITYGAGSNETISTPLDVVLAISILVAATAGWIGYRSWNLARCFVLRFEIWPRSHLAIVRTAGIWQDQVHLIPWQELPSNSIPRTQINSSRKSGVRVRLVSGHKLIFDHENGVAPQTWAALSRFLQKRSLPGTDPSALTGARAL
jgi:hypothetical protein